MDYIWQEVTGRVIYILYFGDMYRKLTTNVEGVSCVIE